MKNNVSVKTSSLISPELDIVNKIDSSACEKEET